MKDCVMALPSTGNGMGALIFAALLLGGGIVAVRASRHRAGRLMAVALPIVTLVTFNAPITSSNDDCPPETTTSLSPTTTVAPNSSTIAPDTSTTVPPVTTTTVAEQTALKIVFLGHIRRDGESNFEALRGGNLILCPKDTQDQTLCVTFFSTDPAAQPGSFETRILRISDNWSVFALGCNVARLYDRVVTRAEAIGTSVLPIGQETSPASYSDRPLTNSDTVYVVTDDNGC